MRVHQFPLATLLAAAIALPACGSKPSPDANPAGTASVYSSHGDSGARQNGIAQTATGSELEAPARLRGFVPRIDAMAQEPLDRFNKNLTAYKNTLGDVVKAMASDRTRLGLPGTGTFSELSDSMLNEIGGGTGFAPPMSDAQRQRLIGQLHRLIGMYESDVGRASR
ncbi:MAG TPA: hypothetical protein VFW66_10150 [Gemmatimonadales bacterium]|nr:hypothetical protein [Gemmatimonadales bacterium]